MKQRSYFFAIRRCGSINKWKAFKVSCKSRARTKYNITTRSVDAIERAIFLNVNFHFDHLIDQVREVYREGGLRLRIAQGGRQNLVVAIVYESVIACPYQR